MGADNRRRDLLHMNSLDAFAAWAATVGWRREDPKGKYEVLRLRHEGKPPLLFYRHEGGDHATSIERGTRLVHRWLRERKQEQPSTKAAEAESEQHALEDALREMGIEDYDGTGDVGDR